MASSMSVSPFHFAHLITVKLNADNFMFWRAQILPILRSHVLMGYVDGTFPCPSATIDNPRASESGQPPRIPNPAHQAWVQQDQAILSAIISSLTEGVGGMVILAATAQEAWSTLTSSFASQSTAKLMQIRSQLSAIKKHDLTATAYFNKVKSLSDTLTSIGQPLSDEDFISYFLGGLDSDYDAFIEVVSARVTPIPVRDLFAQFLSTEQRIEARKAEFRSDVHSANAASFSAKSGGGGKSSYRSNNKNQGNQYRPSNSSRGNDRAPSGGAGRPQCPVCGLGGGGRPICQLCGLPGHVASRCFKRFQRDFLGLDNDGRFTDRQVAAATQGRTSSYPVDSSWYADTGATDHLTNELDKLTMRDNYHGKDQIHAANGSGSGHAGNSS